MKNKDKLEILRTTWEQHKKKFKTMPYSYIYITDSSKLS